MKPFTRGLAAFAIAVMCANTSRLRAQTAGGEAGPDPVIVLAREVASRVTESLPDYSVKRTTNRYQSGRASNFSATATAGCSTPIGARTPGNCQTATPGDAWRQLDVVTADILTEGAKEVYMNMKIDGRPAVNPGQSGWWSEGEFSNTLWAILSPESQAQFTRQRTSAIGRRAAYRYDYSVDQSHSTWHISADTSGYAPAFGGAIWIDKETSHVLRIEMSALGLPGRFPLATVSSTIEYEFFAIGDGRYLLPSHTETLVCQREPAICHKNLTDFRNYKKYSAESSISFGETLK